MTSANEPLRSIKHPSIHSSIQCRLTCLGPDTLNQQTGRQVAKRSLRLVETPGLAGVYMLADGWFVPPRLRPRRTSSPEPRQVSRWPREASASRSPSSRAPRAATLRPPASARGSSPPWTTSPTLFNKKIQIIFIIICPCTLTDKAACTHSNTHTHQLAFEPKWVYRHRTASWLHQGSLCDGSVETWKKIKFFATLMLHTCVCSNECRYICLSCPFVLLTDRSWSVKTKGLACGATTTPWSNQDAIILF